MHLRSSVRTSLKLKVIAYNSNPNSNPNFNPTNNTSLTSSPPPSPPRSNLETPLMAPPHTPSNGKKAKQWLKDLEVKVDLAKSIWDQKISHFKQVRKMGGAITRQADNAFTNALTYQFYPPPLPSSGVRPRAAPQHPQGSSHPVLLPPPTLHPR